MRTYSGNDSGSHIEPLLKKAKESIWISSPWLGTNYAQQLASLSQKGIEVKIITSNVEYNVESLQILKASENSNLSFLVLDQEKTTFIHSKIYLVDKKYGIIGSANLTYSGLHSNVENLSIAQTEEEVQQIETDFMRIWMTFERKSMSKEELSSATSTSIRSALPLRQDPKDINPANVKSKELVYHPYYFFEYSFRTSVGTRQAKLFQDEGLVVLDAVTRQVVKDDLLTEEINNSKAMEDYVLNTNDKFRLVVHPPLIHGFEEAKELAIKYIQEKNTRRYKQAYYRTVREYIFVPYPSIIRFIKSGFVQVPSLYLDMCDPNGSKYQDIVFGSSGRTWYELVYCSGCQKKISIEQAISCEMW